MDLHVTPRKLCTKILTNLDILRAIIFEKQQNQSKKEPGMAVIAIELAKKVEQIYNDLNQPIIQRDKIKEKIKKIYDYRQKMFKIPRLQRHSQMFLKKMQVYKKFMSEPLDVSRKRYLPKQKKEMRKNQIEPILTEDEDVSYDGNVDCDDENDLDYEPSCKYSRIVTKKVDLSLKHNAVIQDLTE